MTTATLEQPNTQVAPAAEPDAPQKHTKTLPLGERLIRAGIITPDQLEGALEAQSAKKLRLGETLIALGLVDEEQLLPFVGDQVGVPAVRLRDGLVDPVVVRLIPREVADRFKVLALFKVHDMLCTAMAEPQNLHQIDEIERMTGLRVQPVLCVRKAIERTLPRCYEDDFEVDAVTADIDQTSVEVHDDAIHVDLNDASAQAEGSPIINLVNYMIVHAIRQGASDIHIEAGQKHSLVRFRVDGQLREVMRPRKDFHPAIVSRLKVMAKMDIAEHRIPQDGRVHVIVEKREIDLRVSTLPTVLGEKVVLRVLDRANVKFELDELGVPPTQLTHIKQMLARPHGLVLVTGPTGSGKTTTLYSAMELVKSIHNNIITVEDPVEYQLDLINQIHANPNVGMTFASVLRSMLRQDPDIIMVGEIRDAETAEVAIQAALTGHLVLSTLHTNDSAGAITRLMDMGVDSFKIAAALVGVIAQRLVRQICPHCRALQYPSEEILKLVHYEGDERRQFAYGEGCSKCYDTGHQGRQGIYEVLVADSELRRLVGSEPDLQQIRDWHKSTGGTTLTQEGIRLAEEGKTSLSEVLKVTTAD